MTAPQLDAPQPNHPLTAIRRQGVVQDIANAPTTINVFIGGDLNTLVACSYIAEYHPVANDTVLILENQGDFIVLGAFAGLGGNTGPAFSRYTWTATRNGIASGASTDIGTPPTTPWTTGSTSGGNTSTITATKDCFLALYVAFGPQLVINVTLPSTGANKASWAAQTQGGGIYFGALTYTGLLGNGEVVEMNTRNVGAGAANVLVKGFLTLSDAVIGTLQT